MSELTPLISVADLAPGNSAEVVAAGRIFAVFNVDGHFHVIDGICAHAAGPLAEGKLEGCIVTCPWHGWQYDVQTGDHCINPAITQTAWEAVIRDGQVCIRLEDE